MPAKGTSRFVVTDKVLARVQALARKGLSMTQIAHCLGISESCIYRHKRTNEQFEQAIKIGQAKGVARVANALFESALNGNVTAQIFFLKNRDMAAWKDRAVLDANHTVTTQEKDIEESMTPQEAAESYADTLKNGTSGSVVVPIKRST
jgi:predicted DNA-binding transcriptional regulator AlpA